MGVTCSNTNRMCLGEANIQKVIHYLRFIVCEIIKIQHDLDRASQTFKGSKIIISIPKLSITHWVVHSCVN